VVGIDYGKRTAGTMKPSLTVRQNPVPNWVKINFYCKLEIDAIVINRACHTAINLFENS
jgi:hypothetical protein